MGRMSRCLGASVAILVGSSGFLGACTEDLDPAQRRPRADAPEDGPFACDKNAAPAPSAIKRLANAYVVNSLKELFSSFSDAPKSALISTLKTRIELLPSDAPDRYARNDDSVTQDHVDAVVGLAMSAAVLISDATKPYAAEMLKVCGASLGASALQDDACLTKFVTYYGRKAFRRPVTKDEIDDFAKFYRDAVAAGSDGFAALVGRFIAHPNLYYQLESNGEVVSGTPGADAIYGLDRWELLSKLTFLFWSAPPTDALYDRVATTDITADDALGPIIDDLLRDPKAEQGILGFYREWLLLEKTQMPATEGNVLAGQALLRAAGLTSLPPTHREDMNQEVLDLAKHYTLSTEGKLDDILTSNYSFARTEALAKIYGVAPWNGDKDHLVPFPAGQRSGLLSRAAMVASNGEYTRPIIKGVRVLRRVLCGSVPPPPPGLDIKPIVHTAAETTRQATQSVTGDPTCAGCHKTFDAFGFLTERYDPLGRYREKEARFKELSGEILSELPVDSGAVATFAPGGEAKELHDAVGLGTALTQSGAAHSCMVKSYFEFVTGRQNDAADGCELSSLHGTLTSPTGSIKQMIRASVLSPSFRRRRAR
jgi:hypothetical protein